MSDLLLLVVRQVTEICEGELIPSGELEFCWKSSELREDQIKYRLKIITFSCQFYRHPMLIISASVCQLYENLYVDYIDITTLSIYKHIHVNCNISIVIVFSVS